MLIQLNDGVPFGHPVDENNFIMIFRNTSFPDKLTPEILEPYGFGIFEYTQPPQPKKFTKIIEDVPEKGENGVFYQKWKSVGMTSSEKEAITEEQKYIIREERNSRLSSTDWMLLSDLYFEDNELRTIKKYRQNLRDIPSKAGFPWDIKWPELLVEPDK